MAENKNIQKEFISTLTHEIRTPLTSIKGFSKTLLDSWDKLDDNKKKNFLNIILNQSQRLINLCENVLNVAKLDSNTNDFVLVKVNVILAVEKCINIIKMNHPDFEFHFEKPKSELFSLSDDDKLEQILLNVLDNSVKYSSNSKKIEIKLFNSFKNGDYNVISIKNFGSFIDSKDYNKIYEKFYRIDSYLTTKTQGSGLGLYIVKTLLDKMKGKIEVNSSKEDNFCEFLIYLPVYEVEAITKKIKG